MKTHSLIILLLFFISTNAVYCQNTPRGCQKLTQSKKALNLLFADTVQSFSNYYVIGQALGNIRKSNFPIEVRYYVSTANRNVVDIYVLQSDLKTTRVTRLKTMIMEGKIDGFRNVKRLSLRTNLLVKEEGSVVQESLCDVYSLLLANGFFEPIVKLTKEKTRLQPTGYGGGFFEVKLDRNFRNFEDPINTYYEEQMSERDKKLNTIIKYLKSKYLKNEKTN